MIMVVNILISSWMILFDGQDTIYVNLQAGGLKALISSFNLTYKKPSVPMLKELRDSIYFRNMSVKSPYLSMGDTIMLRNVMDKLGREKLYDVEIIALLAAVARVSGMDYDVYCLSRYNARTGDIVAFDLSSLYGKYFYGCYPLIALDGNIISARKFFTVGLIYDIARFPQQVLQVDAPPLLYQLRGFRTVLVKAVNVEGKIPDSLHFEVLK